LKSSIWDPEIVDTISLDLYDVFEVTFVDEYLVLAEKSALSD